MKKATALIDVVEKLCEEFYTNAMHERWEQCTRGKTTHNYSIKVKKRYKE